MFWVLNLPPPLHNHFKDKTNKKYRVRETLLWALERNVLKNKQARGTGKLSGAKLAHLWLAGWMISRMAIKTID